MSDSNNLNVLLYEILCFCYTIIYCTITRFLLFLFYYENLACKTSYLLNLTFYEIFFYCNIVYCTF